MLTIDDRQMEKLRALCREYGVQRLDLFGSGATDEFDPERSDLDFLIRYGQGGSASGLDQYFGLKWALEELFGRNVDLVCEDAVRNRIFRREMERTRKPLYAA